MKLVILDRDGVINVDSASYVKSADEWHPIHGSLEAMARLTHAGYLLVVATNQSALARGLLDMDAFSRIHQKMERLLADLGGRVDGIFFCPHGPEDGCNCRKPAPGLLLQIAQRYQTTLQGVYFVGDKVSDIEAARAAGAEPVLVRTGYGMQTLQERSPALESVPVFDNLASFADWLLASPSRQGG